MFVIGAIILFREARSADDGESDTEEEYAAKADATAHGLKVVATSFLVLFAAEWGDLSQLLTISLVAKYEEPVSVFIGAWGALLAVSRPRGDRRPAAPPTGAALGAPLRGCDGLRPHGSLDRVGDDTLTDLDASRLEMAVHDRYVEVNGDHPMTPDDDAYVREHFVAATPESMRLMLDGLPAAAVVRPGRRHADGAGRPRQAGRGRRRRGPAARLVRRLLGGRRRGRRAGVGALPLGAVRLPARGRCPIRIKQKTERVAEAAAAVDLLRRDPHDPIARGMLGEAVDGVLAVPGLDFLLRPMTAYDRLRFGGPTAREQWVDGPRAEFLTPVAPDWPLRTERLVLRPYEPGDAERVRRGVGVGGVDAACCSPGR